jgi:hypothetical protein
MCHGLQSFCVPASVASIGEEAFALCTSLCKLTFEERSKLTTIQERAFCSCTSLDIMSIAASVQSIDQGCLLLYEVLKEVMFPRDSQVAMLSDILFRKCPQLLSLSNLTALSANSTTSIQPDISLICIPESLFEVIA